MRFCISEPAIDFTPRLLHNAVEPGITRANSPQLRSCRCPRPNHLPRANLWRWLWQEANSSASLPDDHDHDLEDEHDKGHRTRPSSHHHRTDAETDNPTPSIHRDATGHADAGGHCYSDPYFRLDFGLYRCIDRDHSNDGDLKQDSIRDHDLHDIEDLLYHGHYYRDSETATNNDLRDRRANGNNHSACDSDGYSDFNDHNHLDPCVYDKHPIHYYL